MAAPIPSKAETWDQIRQAEKTKNAEAVMWAIAQHIITHREENFERVERRLRSQGSSVYLFARTLEQYHQDYPQNRRVSILDPATRQPRNYVALAALSSFPAVAQQIRDWSHDPQGNLARLKNAGLPMLRLG